MKLSWIIKIALPLILFSCYGNMEDETKKDALHLSHLFIEKPISFHYFDSEYLLFFKGLDSVGNTELGYFSGNDLLKWEKHICKFPPKVGNTIKGISIINTQHEEHLSNYGTFMAYVLANDSLKTFFSNDKGYSWISYNDPPAIRANLSEVNDMKVVRNLSTDNWNLVLLKNYCVEFYVSENLIDWEFQSVFNSKYAEKKGRWTGVEFFPVEDTSHSELKWCLAITSTEGALNSGMGTQYIIGNLTESGFHSNNIPKWFDFGTDMHATVVLNDYLLHNATPLMVSKINNTNSLSVIRNISLFKTNNNYFIKSNPAHVFNNVKNNIITIEGKELKGEQLIAKKQELPLSVDLTFHLNNRLYLDLAEVYGVIFENENHDELIVGYNTVKRYFFISFNQEIVFAPWLIEQSEVDLTILVDKNSVELFALDGLISMTKQISFEDIGCHLKLFADGGKIVLKNGEVMCRK